MFNWRWLAAVAVLVAALSASIWGNVRQADAYDLQGKALSEQTTRAVTAERTLTHVRGLVVKADAKAAETRRKLDNALQENQEWAAVPTPVAVRDSLCDTIRCTPSPSLPAPARQP